MGSTQYWQRQSFPLKVTLSPAGNGRLLERVDGWVGGLGEASTVGQQTMSCGPAARASVCAPPCSPRGFDRIRGRGSVSVARSLRRPRSPMKPMWQRERNGRGVIFLIGIFDTNVSKLHYIASYCVEVSSTPLPTPVVRLRRFQWGSSQNVSELL